MGYGQIPYLYHILSSVRPEKNGSPLAPCEQAPKYSEKVCAADIPDDPLQRTQSAPRLRQGLKRFSFAEDDQPIDIAGSRVRRTFLSSWMLQVYHASRAGARGSGTGRAVSA
jgi:hypothetical protein